MANKLAATLLDSVVIDCELEERHQLVRGLFEKPRVLALTLGMASIKGFKLERTARNIIDTTNNPTQLGGSRRHAIRTESLDQRLCNINDSNLFSITKNLQRADFEAAVSDNSGTLGCNAMAFALYDLPATYDLIPRLFMHVPQNPECVVQTQLDRDEIGSYRKRSCYCSCGTGLAGFSSTGMK